MPCRLSLGRPKSFEVAELYADHGHWTAQAQQLPDDPTMTMLGYCEVRDDGEASRGGEGRIGRKPGCKTRQYCNLRSLQSRVFLIIDHRSRMPSHKSHISSRVPAERLILKASTLTGFIENRYSAAPHGENFWTSWKRCVFVEIMSLCCTFIRQATNHGQLIR